MKRTTLDENLAKQIRDASLNGQLGNDEKATRIAIGRFSQDMLEILQCKDLELETSVAVLDKMIFDHGIPASSLGRLSTLIETPQFIYKSATQTESVVVVSVEMLKAAPILIPIWIEKQGPKGKPNMHWVSSAYAKDDPNILARWDYQGLRIWP